MKTVNDVIDSLETGGAIIDTLNEVLDASKLIPSDLSASPIGIKFADDLPVSTIIPINISGGFITHQVQEGYDTNLSLWYMVTTYNQSGSYPDIYTRTNWQVTDLTIKNEYFNEDGRYQLVAPVGFKLLDIHGLSISDYRTIDVSSISSTEPTTTSTNLIPSLDPLIRYLKLNIHSSITGYTYIAYKTYRNYLLQKIIIPIGTSNIPLKVSKGDYITELYAYNNEGGNTGSININISGIN